MAAKGTTKSKTTVKVEDNTKVETADNWWYNLPPYEQDTFRDKFKSRNAPTDEELVAAYEETHEASGEAKPATPELAKAWWNSLYPDERARIRDKADAPPDDVLMAMYDDAHKSAPEQQVLTGEEPPTVQPATPYASATNPGLMANDAVAGENAPLYAGSPFPEGYQPPPPVEPPPP